MMHKKKYEDAFALAAIVFLTLATAACFLLDHFLEGPAAEKGVFLILGLAALAGACAIGIVKFSIPLLSALRIFQVKDMSYEQQEQTLNAARRKNSFSNYIFDLLRTMNSQREQRYSLEILKKQAELNALQSQINPHFLYNTLDSIRGQLMGAGIDSAAETIESLSNLFRYSINPKTVYNTLEQELENIKNYMNIITYRFGRRIQLRVMIDDERILDCEMPKLTLQPIIENSIHHGLGNRDRNGQITIRVFASDRGLHVQVSDNGVGISKDMLDELNHKFRNGSPILQTQGSGIALVNVNERIRMRYGEDYGLYVNSDTGVGTEVQILLPFQPVSNNNAID